ncbi:DUF3267 domain-containing protein [Collinsella sp. zg1085]|uniref:DUF3267 domain-containing protein n=1 Tax=Collinsella sp. zg1085 TaxID=2844380 RepID=UPI001C0E7AEF|nr:DUF3267 domain-containing protein [Collinsella sp. zg1085]QWT17255.1 DUF3267 domain-containing protein [Collinsella sp. zg1085]
MQTNGIHSFRAQVEQGTSHRMNAPVSRNDNRGERNNSKAEQPIFTIDFFEDAELLPVLTTYSMRMLAVALVLGVGAFFAAPYIMHGISWAERDALLSGKISCVGWLLGIAGSVVLCCVVHELIHALCFKLFGPVHASVYLGCRFALGICYASAPGIRYRAQDYMCICLAPAIIVSLVCVFIACYTGLWLTFFAIASLHLAACTGDFYMVARIWQYPQISSCEDTAQGMIAYVEDDVCAG